MGRNELIQMRRGTGAQWVAANPVLDSGELGVELDTAAIKIGDASTPWVGLGYATSPSAGLSAASFGAVGDGVTNDTLAIQNAVNACSALGTAKGAPVPLQFSAGHTYVCREILPASYVDVRGYGATLKFLNPGTGNNRSIFHNQPGLGVGTSVTRFSLRGLTYQGTGLELSQQGLCYLTQSSQLVVEDCYMTNLVGHAIRIEDCQYAWVCRNVGINVGTGAGNNAFNFVSGAHGSTSPLQHLWVDSNHVEGFNAEGITLVGTTAGTPRTDPVIDAHITNNTSISSATATAWCIAVEQTGTSAVPNVSRIDISGNTCVQQGSGTYGIALTSALSNDPLSISEATVVGNRVLSNTIGILSEASRAAITGNSIVAATDDILLVGPGSSGVANNIVVSGNGYHLGSGLTVHQQARIGAAIVVSGNSA